jgi:hypothetical protein
MNAKQTTDEFRFSARWTLAVFLAALGFHFYFVTVNWTYGFMPGHEFRQAQTAIITEYINRQNNFGIYYETPILGKPWAFPLEFPFYQWTVALVKRTLSIEYYEAARGISLSCFYLALPAVFLLLGSCRISGPKRWLLLSLILVAPVYIFYSRAFLIDPMAMMFSAWFLTAFIRAMKTRSWKWWWGASVVGTIGILIKSLVFLVWLFPAALFGAWTLWREWRTGAGPRSLLRTVGFGVGAVVAPYVAITWWVGYTDAIKEAHRSAWIFTSKALTEGNFGTFSLESRLARETWSVLGERWSEVMAPTWFILGYLLLGVLLCPKSRKYIIGAFLIWMFGQLAFPYAYAFQDYYFYAGSIFAILALGFVALGMIEELRAPLMARLCLAAAPFLMMGHSYLTGYYSLQSVKSPGGSGMTAFFRDVLPSEGVIVGVGHDWSAIVPYYAKRRGLMIRSGLEYDDEYLRGAFEDLDGLIIGALVITGESRFNETLVHKLVSMSGMVSTPLFTHRDSHVYVSPFHYADWHHRLGPGGSRYPNVELIDQASDVDFTKSEFSVPRDLAESTFPMITPVPHRIKIRYGYNIGDYADESVLSFHPDSDLWIRPQKPKGSVNWRYGMIDAAWGREGDKSDGVVFIVQVESPDGSRREIYRDEVVPVTDESKRGIIDVTIEYEISAEEVLVFSSRARGNAAYDWAFVVGITAQ